jgi:amidase
MTRSAADAAAILGVIAGADAKDPTASLLPVPDYLANMSKGLKGVRVGIDLKWSLEGIDEPSKQALMAMIEVTKAQGAIVKEVKFPDPQHAIDDWFPLCGAETAVAHEATYPSRKSEYGAGLAGLIDLGHALSGMDYQKIILRRHDFRGRVDTLFQDIDLLLIPTTGIAAPSWERMSKLATDAELLSALLKFTCPFDMTGQPTITLPAGFTPQGMPIGCQFVGRHFEEEMVIRAGWAFQQATDWHRHHPKV